MIGRACRKAHALFTLYLSYMLEYRAEIYLWVAASVLPLILLGVWAQAAESGAFALSRVEFIRYFVAVFVVRQFSFIWVIWEFEELVVSGNLSQQLLQPLPLQRAAVVSLLESCHLLVAAAAAATGSDPAGSAQIWQHQGKMLIVQ